MARSTGPEVRAEEEEALAALHAGDRRRALALVMDAYGERVLRYAFAMVRDRQLAEEVRQQVFVEVFRDLHTYTGRAPLRTWLFGIARHRCLDAVKRHNRWRRRFKNDPPDEDDEEPADDDPSRMLEDRRLSEIIARCLGRLAPAARDAVVLRYHQELSYEEAAQLSGDRANTLQQRVARALPVLRRCVEAELNRAT